VTAVKTFAKFQPMIRITTDADLKDFASRLAAVQMGIKDHLRSSLEERYNEFVLG